MVHAMIHANKRGLAINALKQEDLHYCRNRNFNGARAIVTTEIAALSLYATHAVRYKDRRDYARPLISITSLSAESIVLTYRTSGVFLSS